MSLNPIALGDNEAAMNDLGPLAWVLDELRKSLDGAAKAMRRFVRDAELARGSELTDLDASHLRIARQQLHQAVGALEMVGMVAPAKILRAMESLAQKFVQRPELCSEDAAVRLERASFAVTEYLEGVLKGKDASPVALFPQYRGVMELASTHQAHPADLSPYEWRWHSVSLPSGLSPLAYSPDVRSAMDQSVLKIVKTGDSLAAQRIADICGGLARGQTEGNIRTFWAIAAGFYEAVGMRLLPDDVYVKRTASRILQQYASLAKGGAGVSDRLAEDLVFFCRQAVPTEGTATLLSAVRSAYAAELSRPVDYANEQFGRFDPAVLVLARKRIAAAAETWSALAGGDTHRIKAAGEQFAAVTESMVKLHPESAALASALTQAIDVTVRSGSAPLPPVAIEVATAVLYLEAAYEDLDPTESQLGERSERLAQRLRHVSTGAEPEPMESWMEELYRRVSDRQTMGSVMDELRSTLVEVEAALDLFFRNPLDKSPLREVPNRLSQMRGVFSVLGLDQPAIAALRMRASVEKFLVEEVDAESSRTGIFERLGNSLGAMGFLIDMLSYQRTLAKKLFVYDEAVGEFRPLMGRERVVAPMQVPLPVPVAASKIELPPIAVQSPLAAVDLQEDDEELLDIFLDEAKEVVQTAQSAIRALAANPGDLGEQTTLRRAFHTLKGSSRMVGLTEFGESAWAFEQLLNSWLAEQHPVSEDLIALCSRGIGAFALWVDDIESSNAGHWSSSVFRRAADALRLDGRLVDLLTTQPDLPSTQSFNALATQRLQRPEPTVETPLEEPALEMAGIELIETLDFEATQMFGGMDDHGQLSAVADSMRPQQLDSAATADVLVPDLENFDFDFEAMGAQTDVPDPQVVELSELGIDLDLSFDTDSDTVTVGSILTEIQPENPVEIIEDALVAVLADDPAESKLSQGPQESPEPIEPVKVIGSLRLGIPLYNVYLNEADEWSRRLQTELSEWALEWHQAVPDSVVTLAHSLGGSSATVGFTALSNIAKSLERALEHVQLYGEGSDAIALAFSNAAEDIRRLLHQFAAGFLKEPDQALLEALHAITEMEFKAPALEPLDSDVEVLPPEAQEPIAPVAVYNEPVVAPFAAAPVSVAAASDDQIDALDQFDEDLLPIFQEEASELLPALGTALRQWVARPDNLSARGEVLRVLHTLKGSARLAGAMRLGEMSHRM